MLDDLKEQLKVGYAQAKAEQAQHLQHPLQPTSKNYFRKIGVVLFILGCVAAVINAISWYVVGRALIIVVATMIALWGFGIWMMVTGKAPKRK